MKNSKRKNQPLEPDEGGQGLNGADGSPRVLPVLPVHDEIVVFPNYAAPFYVGRPATVRAVEEAMAGERLILIVAQADQDIIEEDPPAEALYEVGTVCRLLQLMPIPDDAMRVVVEGLYRARVIEFQRTEGYLTAVVEPLELQPLGDSEDERINLQALMRSIKDAFEEACDLGKQVSPEVVGHLLHIEDAERLLDQLTPHLSAPVAEKQRLLEVLNLPEALLRLRVLLEREVEVLRIERDIENQVRQEVGDSQKEFILRERLKAIQEELGSLGAGEADDLATLRRAIEERGLTEEARRRRARSCAVWSTFRPRRPRAWSSAPISRRWSNCRGPTYDDALDIRAAARILDEDHHGLGDVKERITEFLAVRQLTSAGKSPILCFVGPPGVGKTSIGKSIARAMGRKFTRMSLGGIRDEAEIRGHRRTYIGSMPGRIISTLRQLGVKNPVFMLDEVDKIGADFRGDPAAALLEALDPEQNHEFSDHYLEVRFDLSEVMFLLTANVLDTIPPALLDRMEVIEFSGYIEDEKLAIARDYLVPKQIAEHGLRTDQCQLSDHTLLELIRHYTRESGVRNLDRTIAQVCRKVAREVAGGRDKPRRVSATQVEKLIGPARYLAVNEKEETDQIGVAAGLATTSVGGNLLSIEVGVMPGSGELQLTGRLGDVMKESAQAALTYIRSRAGDLGIAREPKTYDIHVHVPEGATPRTGRRRA